MITDQKQTGVPNGNAFKMPGISPRTQLVKPNQVNNIGRSMPQNQNLAPALSQMQKQAPQFNPVTPAPQQTQQTQQPDISAQAPAQMPDFLFRPADQAPVIPNTPSALDQVPQSPALNPTAEAPRPEMPPEAAPVQMDIDVARDAMRRMSDRDILTLLDELGSGSLRGGNR